MTWLLAGLAILYVASLGGCKKESESYYGPRSAGWMNEMRARITEEISDPDKSSQMIKILDEIVAMSRELDDSFQEAVKEVAELDRSYNTTREEFAQPIAKFNAKRVDVRDRMVGKLFEMKSTAGRTDWQKLSDVNWTMFNSWLYLPKDY